MTLHPALDGIELVVFDKDGTLISFEAMWSGWARELGSRLEVATRRPVSGDVFATIGFDPVERSGAGRRAARGRDDGRDPGDGRRGRPPLVPERLGGAAGGRGGLVRAGPGRFGGADRRILPALFGALRAAGRLIAVATTDDRAPTEATLRALGVRGDVAAIACGDDGVGVKPDPAMLLALCQATGVWPARTAMIGDTPADLAMGRAAGAGRVVGVLSGVGSREELAPLADAVLGSVGELLVAG